MSKTKVLFAMLILVVHLPKAPYEKVPAAFHSKDATIKNFHKIAYTFVGKYSLPLN